MFLAMPCRKSTIAFFRRRHRGVPRPLDVFAEGVLHEHVEAESETSRRVGGPGSAEICMCVRPGWARVRCGPSAVLAVLVSLLTL